MKLLFHITGYKCPEQFAWLYRAIYNESDLFIIHVDQKSPDNIHAGFREITKGHSNTHFIPSLRVIWGGTGLIRAELDALRLGFRLDNDWQYLINLTAQDYPNCSMEKIRSELKDVWPLNFVMCIPLKEAHWRIRKRTWFHYYERDDKRHFSPIPKLPSRKLPIRWHGPWWHVLTRDFCEWWLTDPKGEIYFQELEYAGMPDELLIQNLIHQSPFKDRLKSECKHEIIWRYPGEPVSVTAHPNVLTMNDFSRLKSSKAYFARKFDEAVDRDILKVLAQEFNLPMPQLSEARSAHNIHTHDIRS